MRKTSRKPRVVWFPPTNANSISPGGGVPGTNGYQVFTVNAGGGAPGDFGVAEIPLVIDGQSDPLDAAGVNTLSDIENSGYRLRRIVGKIWVGATQRANDGPSNAVVTAGIIVRRTNEITGVSLAFETTVPELLSPGEIRNYGDPWVWRRSWLLFNAQNQSTQFPFNSLTNEFFSAVDGPHVDQKTARIVSSEERLFLTVSATALNVDQDPQDTMEIQCVTDLRVLGSMRTSSGNRRNASR